MPKEDTQPALERDVPVTLRDFAPQGEVAHGLMRTLEDGTFVHAYLISGMAGVGKRTLARLMAQYLLCQAGAEGDGFLEGLLAPVSKPCGVCAACRQVLSGNHPDLVWVCPGRPISPDVEKGKQTIPVDEIREVLRIVSAHTYEGGRRVVCIEQADKMNAQAQNCLLKTLEEPAENTVFLLLTERRSLLLPTIVSRCRSLSLHAWPDEVVLRALEKHGAPENRRLEAARLAGGSIGQALTIASDEGYWQRRAEVMRDFFDTPSRSDILRISGLWKDRKDQAEELLNDVGDMLRTLLQVRLGRAPQAAAADFPEKWRKMAAQAELSAFTSLLDAVSEARRLRINQVTWQAVVERLLLRLMEEKNRW